jgi:hypothetical protein
LATSKWKNHIVQLEEKISDSKFQQPSTREKPSSNFHQVLEFWRFRL